MLVLDTQIPIDTTTTLGEEIKEHDSQNSDLYSQTEEESSDEHNDLVEVI